MSRYDTAEKRAAHAAYERNRQRAIREGTWNPRRALEPVRKPSALDWAWTAGFLEGEGSFGWDRTSHRVRAVQREREPLQRLLELFGGSIHLKNSPSRRARGQEPVWEWLASGERARQIMRTLRPMMSTRRQTQIDAALAAHAPVPADVDMAVAFS